MRRRDFLKTAGTFACFGAGSSAAERRPNVLFILADQWRAQAVPAAGNKDIRVPNLDRLAQEGMQFNRAYAADPLCTPSRAALATGRFPHACGVPRDDIRLPLNWPTLSSQLKDAGYRTGYIGEWRLDGNDAPGYVPAGPRRRGFDYWAAFNRGSRFFDSLYFRDRPEPIRTAGFEPDYQTELAAEFIEQNRQNPFFLFLSWGPPRPPRNPPARVAQSYIAGRIQLRANVPVEIEQRVRNEYADYYATCTALDGDLGRLLDVLDRHNLVSETVVVFTSDHGDMLGSHGLEDKNVPYEESARIPLVVRYPLLLKPGTQRDDLMVSNVDLMPTLLRLCRAPVPETVQGKDLLAGGQESIFAEGKLGSADEWRMVVRGLDKLVLDSRLEVTHLYNLGQDPLEMENLAREPSQELKRDELRALLKEWMRRTEDRMDASGLKKR